MITSFIAGVELAGVIILAVYSLLDNERIWSSVFSAIMGSILSGVLGYQLLFGLVQTETETARVMQDYGLGYYCIMAAILMFVVSMAVVADYFIRAREAKNG